MINYNKPTHTTFTLLYAACVAFFILICFSVNSYADDVNYKTCYPKCVSVVNNIDYFSVYDKDGSEFVMNVYTNCEYVCATSNVCVRKAPNTNSECVGKLEKGSSGLRYGQSDSGWSLMLFDGDFYFIWSEYLSREEHLNNESTNIIMSVDNLNHDESSEQADGDDEWEYLGKLRISSYCTKCNSCGARATAIGKRAEEWYCCAMNGVPLGSTVKVKGYGTFKVWDRGPKAMNGACWVDIFVCPNECDIWDKADVWIKR